VTVAIARTLGPAQSVRGGTSFVTTDPADRTEASPIVRVWPAEQMTVQQDMMAAFFPITIFPRSPVPPEWATIVDRNPMPAPSCISTQSGYSFSRYTSSPIKTLPSILTPRSRCRNGLKLVEPGKIRAIRWSILLNILLKSDLFMLNLECPRAAPLVASVGSSLR